MLEPNERCKEFDTRELVVALLLPPGSLVLTIFLGLALAVRWPAAGRVVALLATLVLYLISIPAAAGILAAAVGGAGAVDMNVARRAQAIVVLAAGLSGDGTEASGVTLGPLTLERTRYAVRLAKVLQLPVAVSGGIGKVGLTEAELMRTALIDEYALNPRWVEAQSRNTRENAKFTAKMLKADDVTTVLLVTHPFDARRARREFESVGFEVIAAPAQVPAAGRLSAQQFLPSIWALLVSHYSFYELLALARDVLRDW